MKYEIIKTQGTKTSVGAFMIFDEQGNEGFDSDGNNAWDTLEEAKEAKAHAEYKHIGVYEVTFYRHDGEGNELKDDKGEVIRYRADDLTVDDLTDALELNDLTEA